MLHHFHRRHLGKIRASGFAADTSDIDGNVHTNSFRSDPDRYRRLFARGEEMGGWDDPATATPTVT